MVIGVFDTGRADTLNSPQMAVSVFHIERSHYFALKTWVYNKLADFCSYVNFFFTMEIWIFVTMFQLYKLRFIIINIFIIIWAVHFSINGNYQSVTSCFSTKVQVAQNIRIYGPTEYTGLPNIRLPNFVDFIFDSQLPIY